MRTTSQGRIESAGKKLRPISNSRLDRPLVDVYLPGNASNVDSPVDVKRLTTHAFTPLSMEDRDKIRHAACHPLGPGCRGRVCPVHFWLSVNVSFDGEMDGLAGKLLRRCG